MAKDTRKKLTRDQALLHIFIIIDRTKGTIEPQVTARVSLLSLWMDSRIEEETYVEIDGILSECRLMEFDYLIRV